MGDGFEMRRDLFGGIASAQVEEVKEQNVEEPEEEQEDKEIVEEKKGSGMGSYFWGAAIAVGAIGFLFYVCP